MKIGVVTLFPKAFEGIQSKEAFGLVGRSFEESKVVLHIEDLRVHGERKHQVVDDTPYGGGDGMVLKAEPIKLAVQSTLSHLELERLETKVVFLTPAGSLWMQKTAESWVEQYKRTDIKGLILICGRYAGFDQRVIEELSAEEISIGPYVLNGGELPALCIMESLIRLLPGVLGNKDSAPKDSFSRGYGGAIEPPSYTKPQEWSGRKVPEVLLSGDHLKIEKYRKDLSDQKTVDWKKQVKNSLFPSEGC